MSIRAVLTDRDGTRLEGDGSVRREPLAGHARLAAAGVPVFAVTSKTAAEIDELRAVLGLTTPAGFENGAGITCADRSQELLPEAVPVARLAQVADELRRTTAAPVRTLMQLGDEEVASLTGLAPRHVALARQRVATLPLLVEARWDEALRAALPSHPRLRLLRGNRFLHLQGDHEKAAVVRKLLATAGDRAGLVVACGDAPNDVALLAAADVAVIVPGKDGPHPDLLAAHPGALIAPAPHGRGWAAVLAQLLDR